MALPLYLDRLLQLNAVNCSLGLCASVWKKKRKTRLFLILSMLTCQIPLSDPILAALSTTWVCAPACCQLNKAGLGGSLQQQQQHPSRDAFVFCFSFLSSNEVSVPPGLARSRPAGSTTDAVCSPEPRLISQIRRLCCRAETELCCRASLTSVSSSAILGFALGPLHKTWLCEII